MRRSTKLMLMQSGREHERDRIDDRFRDSRGRDHYDNGRFAPTRSYYESYDHRRDREPREDRMSGYYDDGRYSPVRGYYESNDRRQGWEPAKEYYPKETSHSDGMRRIIGFGGSNVEYGDHDEMRRRPGERSAGYASSNATPKLTRATADEWMRSLKNADGSRGAHWTFDEVKNLMTARSIKGDPLTIWVGMNAEYSDGVLLNRKYGVDKPEYYLDAAIAKWQNDTDAVEDKAAAYYEYIVKH